MNIGIDALPLASTGGITRFLTSTLLELQRIDRENNYFLYSRVDFDLPFENSRWGKRIHRRVPFLLSYMYFRRNGETTPLDVFWATRHTFPLGLPATTCKIFTVYDLVWCLYPETMHSLNYMWFKLFVSRAIRRANWIVTISESTRKGIVEAFGIDRSKIAVLYPAAESFFASQGRTEAIKHLVAKYGISENYICTVGTIEPRKNLLMLIKAVKILRDRGEFRHQLLIVGPRGWKCEEIYASAKQLELTEQEVKFLGQIPDQDLAAVYSGAALFVYPSLYEGFGIPLLEAMACGTPIVASNAPAIPEVADGAAVLVSPHRAEEIAEAIARVLDDPQLRAKLIDKGSRRAREFQYEATAQRMLYTLGEIAQGRRLAVRATA